MERPVEPFRNPFLTAEKPSMVFSAAETFYEFAKPENKKVLIAEPEFEWEMDRIGASAPPLKIDDKHWLVCYHGKQNDEVGYTQNFLVFRDKLQLAGINAPGRGPPAGNGGIVIPDGP